jgi:pseudaminic acid synthase
MPNGSFVGLSDHTLGATVPIVATALGAKLIEKHFCLSRSDGGPDTAFSMEPHEFKQMVQAVHDAWSALQPSSSPSEDVNRKYRRSLYVVRDVKAGEPFTQENVRSIRPANGLPPKRLFEVLQRCASDDIAAGTPLADSHLAR